jgi:hypothetical protein
MKAKEMFEELGYEQIILPEFTPKIIIFSKNIGSIAGGKLRDISFTERTKSWQVRDNFKEIMLDNIEGNECSVEEHKAIHQQMKELGWIK